MGTDIRGHLEGLLLAVLSGESLHGYAIIQELRRRSDGEFDLAEGTVYPALQRLAVSGLVDSAWVTVSGRRRRIYRLTTPGHAALEQERAAWQRFSAAAGAVFATPESGLSHG
jgi:PadR family transcriptional regulator, regulatory protein PadR